MMLLGKGLRIGAAVLDAGSAAVEAAADVLDARRLRIVEDEERFASLLEERDELLAEVQRIAQDRDRSIAKGEELLAEVHRLRDENKRSNGESSRIWLKARTALRAQQGENLLDAAARVAAHRDSLLDEVAKLKNSEREALATQRDQYDALWARIREALGARDGEVLLDAARRVATQRDSLLDENAKLREQAHKDDRGEFVLVKRERLKGLEECERQYSELPEWEINPTVVWITRTAAGDPMVAEDSEEAAQQACDPGHTVHKCLQVPS